MAFWHDFCTVTIIDPLRTKSEEGRSAGRILLSTLVLSETPVSTSPPKAHLAFIDGLRAVAALFVMVCHAYFEPANGYYASHLMNHLGLTYGHIAVDVFIVATAYGFHLLFEKPFLTARRPPPMPTPVIAQEL